jgi:hypothetical protein
MIKEKRIRSTIIESDFSIILSNIWITYYNGTSYIMATVVKSGYPTMENMK